MKVLKLVIGSAFVLLMCLEAGAEGNRVGIVGGLNFATVDEQDKDCKYRTAFGIGGLVEIELGGNIALCFEPMYLQKGCKVDEGDNVTMEAKGASIEIPVFLKVPFKAGNITPYVMAGPTLGFSLSA